jgi:TonB family protein
VEDLPILDFVPVKTVDALISGGGDPKGKLPQATQAEPPQPRPQPLPPPPEPKPAQPPEPKPEVAKPEPAIKETPKPVVRPQPKDDGLEPVPDKKPRKVDVSTTMVTRKRDPKADAKAREEAEAREAAREWASARRRLARDVDRIASRLGSEMSGETSVTLKGPGGGGVPYANFLQAVKSVYARAWIVPDGVTDDEATAEATITIARDGKVITARISRPSGNALVDRSVRAALDRVEYAAPLPDDAYEDQRTVTINFNVKARRALG